MKRIWIVSLLVTTLILIDQFTKGYIQSNFILGESIPVIDGLFNFTYVRNKGAAFGMGATSSEIVRLLFLRILPVFVCFFLMYLIVINRNKKTWTCIGYGLVLAGAIGNLIDRFTLDYVVDFFDFYLGSSHFPAFNVADSVINIGVGMLLIEEIFLKSKNSDQQLAKE